VSGSANPLTFTLGGDKSIIASFAINTYMLDMTVVGNGAVERSPDLPSYSHGTTVELTAMPKAGDAFIDWSGGASGTNNPLIITMDSDKSITANFGLVSVSAGAAVTEFALGAISPTPTPGKARIAFALPREARIRVSVMDLQGREVATVADGVYPSGRHEAVWNGRGTRGALPAGVYVVRMSVPGRSFARRMIVTR
jgi:hypothetical protein